MKRLMLSLAVASMLAGVAVAQEPTPAEPVAAPAPAVEQAPRTETWLREQQRRDAADPAVAVRKNAAYRGHARRERMEARKWIGHSMARPMANGTPFMSSYSPEILINVGTYDYAGQAYAPGSASALRPLIR